MLSLAGFLSRVDYKFDGYDLNDLSIPAAGGSSFNQPSINAPAAALCDRGDGTVNRFFQQVNLFATLFRHRRTVVASGIPTPFPPLGLPLVPDRRVAGRVRCVSQHELRRLCRLPPSPVPGLLDGTLSQANLLNFAHDNTMIAHELGHNITQHLTFVRDPSWCGQVICPVPAGWLWFHDLADAWGAHLESTDCIGGWVAKNLGGTNHSRYCSPQNEAVGTPPHHSEAGQLPRRLWVKTPFDASNPGDDFPKKEAAPPMELRVLARPGGGRGALACAPRHAEQVPAVRPPAVRGPLAAARARAHGQSRVHPRRVDAERLRATLGPGQGDGAPVGGSARRAAPRPSLTTAPTRRAR